MRLRRDVARHRRRLGRRAAALLRFSGHVHLQQHALRRAVRRGPPVQLIGERHRIKRMDQREAPGHVLRLVALQMPDQVPRHPPARERWSLELLQRLLHPVLSQVGDARSQCGFHRIHSEALGDRDERDRAGPARRGLPSSDLGPYVGQPLGQGSKIHNRKK